MSVQAILAQTRELVEPALRRAADDICPAMRRVAGYHHGWLDEHGNPQPFTGGKAIRPALALLSARAAGAPPDRGVPGAVAVELVQDFSLLHDDIMDGDTERRHRPAAWSVFGTSRAILAGDALLTAALDVVLAEPSDTARWAGRCVTIATQRLITGQAADLDFEKRSDVTVDECVEMAEDKTAALFACACSIGAVLAGAPPELPAGLSQFGLHLGLAFQLVDDLLGIWGDPEVTGKPVLSDLRARKKSIPVVAALNAGTPSADQLADLYLRDAPLTEEELALAAKLVEDTGGRRWAESEAERRLTEAERRLAELNPPPDVADQFIEIAHFVTARDR